MFTGLIKDIGTIKGILSNVEGKQFVIKTSLAKELEIDDSLSVNGVCQTIVKKIGDSVYVQAVRTSLEKTTLGKLQNGDRVNLELAMRFGDRMGGHMVTGHVNGCGKVFKISKTGNSYQLRVLVDSSNMNYIVKEGSITIDGISLTVSDISDSENWIEVSVIPHTWENTILKTKRIGQMVNIEVDMIAKYLEKIHAVHRRANV